MAEQQFGAADGLDPTIVLSIGVAVLIGVLMLGYVLLQRSRGSNQSQDGLSGRYPSILIYGPMSCGKTTLLYQLYNKQFVPTQTSMNANILEFSPNNMQVSKTYQFIDFPGHGSKESQIFKYAFEKHYNKGMKALIFVIDITDNNSIVEGAKKLYRLLEKRKFYKRNPKVLILLNKKDALNDSVDIKQKLNEKKDGMIRELNKLRDSYSTLQSINESGDDDTIFLGNQKETLTWNDINCSITWGVCSAIKGQLDDVESFLQQV